MSGIFYSARLVVYHPGAANNTKLIVTNISLVLRHYLNDAFTMEGNHSLLVTLEVNGSERQA